jgi:transposase
MKKEILKFAEENTVEAAAKKYAVTETTIYEWRRAGKRRGTDTGDLANGSTESTKSTGSTESTAQEEDGDPKEVRDRQVLAMWRQHPGYGPSQIRNMLKRGASGSRSVLCGT